MNSFKLQKFSRHSDWILFSLMTLVALLTFRTYGISWDEGTQRLIGEVNWNYIFKNDNSLFEFHARDHGVAFELPLILVDEVFGLKDPHYVYYTRHILTHLFFLVGAVFCYRLVDLLYKNKFLNFVAFLLFTLHPHIYSHSFFNSKDVPFLSLFMICFYLAVKLFQSKKTSTAAVLGLCLGLMINIRMMGVLLPGILILFLLVDAVREKKFKSHLAIFSLMLVCCIAAIFATWPYLWQDPFSNFYSSFKSMSRFDFPLENLFKGKLISAKEIGWDYIPVWFLITTPIPYLIAGLFGILSLIYFCIRHPAQIFTNLNIKANLLFLSCFFLPVIAIIILKSVLYDGWRHLFFIYPAFVLLIVYGLSILISRYKRTVELLSVTSLLYVVGVMIYLFPFQHVFFNAFVTINREPEYIRKHYDMDYWGTSYKQSLEYILKSDPSPTIAVCVDHYSGMSNIECLVRSERIRLKIVENRDSAKYFVTEYRWHPEDFPFEDEKVYSIKVFNNTINSVYKLK